MSEKHTSDQTSQAQAAQTNANPSTPPESSFPHCAHCDKPVESLLVTATPNHPQTVTIEYHCHGESAWQDMPASVMTDERGLAGYTAFNDFTSGLLPKHSA